MTAVLTAIRRVLVGTGSTAFTLVGACLIGFGVPLLWIWVASQLYDKPGAVNGSVAAFIGTGILVSYWGILLIASWVRARLLGRGVEQEPGAAPREPWNRSMRDTPYQARPAPERPDRAPLRRHRDHLADRVRGLVRILRRRAIPHEPGLRRCKPSHVGVLGERLAHVRSSALASSIPAS